MGLGIKALAVPSTGAPVPTPRHRNRALKHCEPLRARCRGESAPTGAPGNDPRPAGKRPRREVTRIHTRIANPRTDAIHKLTTDVATTYGTVVVEDLTVSGMLGEPHAGPAHRRRLLRRDHTPARRQDRVQQRATRRRRPVVPFE